MRYHKQESMRGIRCTAMKDAFFNKESLLCTVAGKTIPMLLVGADTTPYFRCNDAAQLLGYSNFTRQLGNMYALVR